MTDQTAERDQYARAIREAVRIRLGTNALRLAEEGRPVMLNMSEAEAAADAVLAVRDAARQAAGQSGNRPAERRPRRPMHATGPELTVTTDTLRLVLRQVGWLGQTGAFYDLDENPLGDGHERGGVAPLYFPAHPDRLDDLVPDEPAPVVEQPAEAQPAEEARPPRVEWRIELLDVDGWMPSGLVRPDRELAAQYLAGRRKQRPDATFRLVRETTTWTVEEAR